MTRTATRNAIELVFSFMPPAQESDPSFASAARSSATLGGPVDEAVRGEWEARISAHGDPTLWQTMASDLAPEFSSSFTSAFGQRREGQPLGSDAWTLDNAGLDIINGGAAPHGGFKVAWSRSVRERLAVPHDIAVAEHRFRVIAVTARVYSSGAAQLALRIEAAPPPCERPATALLELAFAIEHATRLEPFDQRIRYAKESAGQTSFAGWVRWLLAQFAGRAVEARRAFVAIAAQGYNPQAEGMAPSEFAYRLARLHTPDYSLAPDAGQGVYRPFGNISIATCSEGAAWVVEAGGASFLDGYVDHVWRRSGLPMCMLALHERTVLVALADAADAPERDSRDDARHMHRLEDLWDRFVRFRLNYRIDEISTITHHKQQYENLRHAFGLDALSNTLDRDLKSAAEHLDRRMQHRRDRRARWLIGVVSVLGSSLVLLHLADIVLRLLYGHPMQLELARHWLAGNADATARYEAALHAEAFWMTVAIIVALAIGLVIYLLSGRKPPGH